MMNNMLKEGYKVVFEGFFGTWEVETAENYEEIAILRFVDKENKVAYFTEEDETEDYRGF